MSSKSSQQPKKLSVPRELQAIYEEYTKELTSAGQLQYQIEIETEELSIINERLRKLNQEASARKQLDAVKQAAETPTAEVVKNEA